MKKKILQPESATSSVITHSFEINHPVKTYIPEENERPVPPSEETVAHLNAIAREYPFCAYMKQTNLYLL